MRERQGKSESAEVVRAGYAALNRRDLRGVLGQLGRDCVFRFRTPGGDDDVLRGRVELERFYDALLRFFDRVHLVQRELDADGDTVHVRGTVTLRVRGNEHGSQSSFRHTYRVQNGVVVSGDLDDPVNPLELMRLAEPRQRPRQDSNLGPTA